LSLFRPLWLEDVLTIRPGSTSRVGRLKGFQPQHVVALQDPLYADDPTFWIFSLFQGGVALNLGHIGVQTPSDDTVVAIVDGAIVDGAAADDIVFDVVQGGQTLLALANGTPPVKRNRREQSRTTAVERAGLLSIGDNTNAFVGTPIAAARVAAGASLLVPLGYRMFGGEQFFARNATVNTAIEVTLWGRLTSKGQR
jgi:hypothetical protein